MNNEIYALTKTIGILVKEKYDNQSPKDTALLAKNLAIGLMTVESPLVQAVKTVEQLSEEETQIIKDRLSFVDSVINFWKRTSKSLFPKDQSDRNKEEQARAALMLQYQQTVLSRLIGELIMQLGYYANSNTRSEAVRCLAIVLAIGLLSHEYAVTLYNRFEPVSGSWQGKLDEGRTKILNLLSERYYVSE